MGIDSDETAETGAGRHCVRQRFDLRGWLEPEAARVSAMSRQEAGYTATGQVAPFGAVRLVYALVDDRAVEERGWVTLVLDGGDSLYGPAHDGRATLAVVVDGGTGVLDGASGWMRISRGDTGTSAMTVTGEVLAEPVGSPPRHHLRTIGDWERTKRAVGG